jgi:hypothetical protein
MFSMLLNMTIFNAVIAAAQAKAAGNAALLRAIERAATELNRAKYWAYDSTVNVLKLQSTTNPELYTVDDQHVCAATTNGHKQCKHLVARRLMQRYAEALQDSINEQKGRTVTEPVEAPGPRKTATRVRINPDNPVKRFFDQHAVAAAQELEAVPPVKESLLEQAEQAVFVPRTIKGEKYGGIDI